MAFAQARPPRQLAWMRSPEALSDDPALHNCIVAYGSDLSLLETALLPHGHSIPSRQARPMRSRALITLVQRAIVYST